MQIVTYRTGLKIGYGPAKLFPEAVERSVQKTIRDVRRSGDRAVVAYTKKYDGITLTEKNLRFLPADIRQRARQADALYWQALRAAIRNIRRFYARQKARDWQVKMGAGIVCGQTVRPIEKVGVYVPGGKAAYPSSLIMNVVPAQLAGVKQIIVVTPPRRLLENPYVCAALCELGVEHIYGVGGAQAIAALAFGTRTIPRVDKIVGPGNQYVQCAKRLVYGAVDIDMIAGPSEVVVLADGSARPAYIAADMISQAEHDETNRSSCVTTSRQVARQVLAELKRQVRETPRRAIVEKSLHNFGKIIVARGLPEAIEICNQLAPEHLEIMTASPRSVAKRIRNAGSIFLGSYAPVPLGDFFAGPNHILPTETTARFYSPLGVYDFIKYSSITEYSKSALVKNGPAVMRLAEAEGFGGHKNAIAIRLNPRGGKPRDEGFSSPTRHRKNRCAASPIQGARQREVNSSLPGRLKRL